MSVKSVEIGKGISLNYIDSKKFKTNFLSVNFVTPLRKENASKNSLLMRVLNCGTEKYPTIASLNQKLDYLYASSVGVRNYKRGEAQIFGLAADVLGNEYTEDNTDLVFEICEFLKELIFHPILDENGYFLENYVKLEKENLCNDILALINDKRRYAPLRCHEEMCKGEAYGISEYGDIEEIKKITPKSLFEHYKKMLESARIEMFFIGNYGFDKLKKQMESLFAGQKRAEPDVIKTQVIKDVKEVKNIKEEMPVSQGKLSLGFRTGITVNDADYPALVMFNETFGGSVSSKLFMNVREKMSLCYYCSSSIESFKGLMTVNSGIETANFGRAKDEILLQFDNIKKGELNDYEISSARRSLQNAYRHVLDSAASMELYYLGRVIAGDKKTIEECAERFDGVTREQIVSVANKISLDTVYFMSAAEKKKEGSEK